MSIPLYLIVTSVVLVILRFENQRWFRARAGGMRGSSFIAGQFVDFTAACSFFIMLSLYAALIYDYGIWDILKLLVLIFLANIIWSLVASDNIIIWVVSTILIWPVIIFLATQVSWFGLIG